MAESKEKSLIISWFLWHFYETPDFLVKVWKNYFLFGLNYFSVYTLLKTFFSPWKKYNWRYPKSFNLTEFFNSLVSNIFSRILGSTFRTVLIIIGILGQIVIFFAGLIAIIFWFLMPFIIVGGFIFLIL